MVRRTTSPATKVSLVSIARQQKAKRRTDVNRRDIFQRKAYAIRRMSLATKRLTQATSTDDREKAGRWIAMWSTISGIRQFPLGSGGGSRKKPKQRSMAN
jgi:hypothetical protein